MVINPEGLSGALSKGAGREDSNDLLGYFVNFGHPITRPILETILNASSFRPYTRLTVYLGYIPLFLAVSSLAGRNSRRQMLPWLILVLAFLLLRLGSWLTINGVEFENVLLPKFHLAKAFPHIFQPFWDNRNFHAGALLPFSVLTCYGLMTLLQLIPARRRVGVILLVAGVVAFEYYQVPGQTVKPDQVFEFVNWFGQEDDQESIRLINLPMGGQTSKYYGFYQTLNGYPHVEGRPTRTPPAAFDYIDSSFLLTAWRQRKNVYCLPANKEAYSSAVDQLLIDGFTHIIVHHRIIHEFVVWQSFTNVPSSYEDEHVTIYRLHDLQGSCNTTASLGAEALSHSQSVAKTPAITPNQGASILSIHTYESGVSEPPRHNLATLKGQYSLIRIAPEDVSMASNTILSERLRYVDNLLSAHSIILFIYDPSRTELDVINTYGDWISRHFKKCERFTDNLDAVIELYIRPDFPCELAIAEYPLSVDYNNGIQLGNLLIEQDGSVFELYLLWRNLPYHRHSYSIQLFDTDGNKAYGQDFVIRNDPLARRRLEHLSLAPGEYVAKLIVYNYDTGVSIPGTVTSSQSHLDRELEIARITIE